MNSRKIFKGTTKSCHKFHVILITSTTVIRVSFVLVSVLFKFCSNADQFETMLFKHLLCLT